MQISLNKLLVTVIEIKSIGSWLFTKIHRKKGKNQFIKHLEEQIKFQTWQHKYHQYQGIQLHSPPINLNLFNRCNLCGVAERIIANCHVSWGAKQLQILCLHLNIHTQTHIPLYTFWQNALTVVTKNSVGQDLHVSLIC